VIARDAKGAITVSSQARFAIQWLDQRLSAFNALYPDIDVRIKAVVQAENSLTEDVDIAVYYGGGRWPNLHADKLYTEYLIPVCSPLLLQESADSTKPTLLTLDDLQHHTLLHDVSRKSWKRWFKQVGVKGGNVNHGPIFSHSALVVQAALHGQGVALAHNVLAKPDIDAGRLVCPFNDVLVSNNAYFVVCRETQKDIGKIASFRNWLLEMVATEQERITGGQIT
ncbi:MAG: transcriptional regulator, partial [Colwellia sp.]|nr:transcriptional regulator [Colwellia sp.]